MNSNEYEEVTKILKSLQQVTTPHNFETDLMRKINFEDFESAESKKSTWQKVFAPAKFIPSVGLAAAAVIILFVINLNSDHPEDPLTIKPRVREDVLVSDPFSTNLELENKIKEKAAESRAEKKVTKPKQNSSNNLKEGFIPQPNISSIYTIDKKGLNFRQINLNFKQREEINKLKQQMFNFIKNNNK